MFLIPESGDVGTVTLFAADRFPHEWEPVATLVEGVNAVDATVHAHDGILWMWLTVGCSSPAIACTVPSRVASASTSYSAPSTSSLSRSICSSPSSSR